MENNIEAEKGLAVVEEAHAPLIERDPQVPQKNGNWEIVIFSFLAETLYLYCLFFIIHTRMIQECWIIKNFYLIFFKFN